MRLQWAILTFFVFLSAYANAQSGNIPQGVVKQSISVSASASLLDNITLTTMRDVNLNSPSSVEGYVLVNPNLSPNAGMMRISGRPGKSIRITYLAAETLLEDGGSGGVVKATYRISGFDSDNQAASVILDIGEANVRIGADGNYYIWLGALLDMTKAKPGSYVSEFIMEIEGN